MKSLKELQDEFQRGILAGDDAILSEVNESAKERRKVLFGVYRNAYVARLAEILGEDYEQLHAYLGDQGFAKLVKSYIAANPSDQRSARCSGAISRLTSRATKLMPSIPRSPSLRRSRRRSPMPSMGPTQSRWIWPRLRGLSPTPGRASSFSPIPRRSA
jgi:hypothetical protein